MIARGHDGGRRHSPRDLDGEVRATERCNTRAPWQLLCEHLRHEQMRAQLDAFAARDDDSLWAHERRQRAGILAHGL